MSAKLGLEEENKIIITARHLSPLLGRGGGGGGGGERGSISEEAAQDML